MPRPLIGVTLDAEKPGGYSKFPWYALRQNYLDAIDAAGGLAVALPHEPDRVADYLERIDALVVTGGAFDVDPSYYGGGAKHATVITKDRRTAFEFGVTKGALAQNKPVLGICGGQQLLHVVLGGKLIQHIPDSVADALAHEQPNPRNEPGHTVDVAPGTLLHRIVGADELAGEQRPSPGGGRRAGRHRDQCHCLGRRDRGHRGAAVPLLHRRAVAPRVPYLRGRREDSSAPSSAPPARERARTHRQAPGARRPLLAPRRRALDRRRPGQGRRHACWTTPAFVVTDASTHRGRRQAAAAGRPGAAVALSQAAGGDGDGARSARTAHHLRFVAQGHAARGHGRPPRLLFRGPAAAHQRRRPRAQARAAGQRLDAALSRPGAWRGRRGEAGGAGRGHHHRGRALRRDPGQPRPPAALQRLARHRADRGQEPRGAQGAGPSRPAGDAADPRRLRPDPPRRAAARHGRRGADPGDGKPARRAAAPRKAGWAKPKPRPNQHKRRPR